jgi:hypothetical protein
MDAIFQRLIEDSFSDLAGLTVDASIPVPEQIVNEIMDAVLQGNKNIRECRVSISGQNKVSVNLKTPLWLWPLNIKLKLESSIDFTSSPKVRAALENNVFLGKLGALFKLLPVGINIQGNQVIVDVQAFLETPEQRKMLDLIKSVEIRTEPAKVIFDIKIKVE